MKSHGSARGLDYSCVVGGTNIKLFCVCFLSLSDSLSLCSIIRCIQTLSQNLQHQILTRFYKHLEKEIVKKANKIQTPFLVCFSHIH